MDLHASARLAGKTIMACVCRECRRLTTVHTEEELRKGEQGQFVCDRCAGDPTRREVPRKQ